MSYAFGPFRLDASHGLVRDGEEIPLPPKVLETLLLFVQSPGLVLTRDSLLETLWPDAIVSDTSLTQNIWLLRKALGDERYIETIPRCGYRFVADVAVVPTPSNVVKMPLPPAPKARPKWLVVASVIALTFAITAATVRKHGQLPAPPFREQVAAARQRPAVAPVPFRNESRNASADWLRTAIPRMLSAELAAGDRVRTLPSDVSGADFVLIGSFVAPPSGTQLRFTARVEDIKSGETLASISVDGSQDDLFALIHRAGSDLREKLAQTVPSPRRAGRGPR